MPLVLRSAKGSALTHPEMDGNLTYVEGLAEAAQATADAAYVKPGPGVPSSDMTAEVQSSLAKADSAVQPAGLTKSAVGLSAVDNTADADKPVSTATATALGLKGDAPLIVQITANTALSVAAHNGNILRLDASRTLEVPEGLGTAFSCIVELPIGATLTVDPTGATILVDTATPAGSTATRTRLHTANPSGVIIKSTATANTLAVSGS